MKVKLSETALGLIDKHSSLKLAIISRLDISERTFARCKKSNKPGNLFTMPVIIEEMVKFSGYTPEQLIVEVEVPDETNA